SLRSSVPGVVIARFLSAGENVSDDPIVTVAQIHPLHVEVIVPVERLGTIVKGQQAEIRPELPLGNVYMGRVNIVDEVVDAASGTFGVRVILSNLSYQIPAGLKCKVRFLDQ
ncbi:MAG: efflux RND transporter periplasmic adaptor subunit, partial [Candidatus Latescibacteria bacterium]|nr:efflux RND transporter periplasmic adaptor subunit [Candidatus Latescibacterota bacterium]